METEYSSIRVAVRFGDTSKGIIRWLFLTIVLGLLLSGSASAADSTNHITVMSFNILRGAWQNPADPPWATRKVKVFETIQYKSPDFVGTQEEGGGQMEDILAAFPAYHEVPGREVSGGILYLHEKWDLVDYGLTRFLGAMENRYFIWGLFAEKETNRMVYFYSTHPPHSGQSTMPDRVAGMELMATHAAARQQQRAPVICTGDFNSEADTDPMLTLTGVMGSLPIEFIYANEDVRMSGFSYGIDHILVLPGTKVVESGVAAGIWSSGSDHPAVFSVFEPWSENLNGCPDGSVHMDATDSTATEEGETTATFSAIREGDTSSSLLVNFSVSGTATEGEDYVLSASSPITIPAGQSSVEIILTPSDDNVYGEGSETVALTITQGVGYVEISAPATTTIEDNDNHEPVVNAGVDRHVVLGEGAWSPADIASTAWYDAADTSTIMSNVSGRLSQWGDKSGNANNAAQGMGSIQPTTGVRTIGGLNVIVFDPAGPNYLLTSLEQLTTVSMYVVGEYEPRGSNAYGGFIGANYGQNATGVAQGLLWRGEAYASATTRFDDPQYSGATPVADRYVDGSSQAEMNFDVPAIYSHQGSGLGTVNYDYFIGMCVGNFHPMWALKGSIGEIIICPEVHTQEVRQKMEGYLAHKWGLATNLPAGHPYKVAVSNIPLVSVDLSDADIEDEDLADPVTQTWTIVSKPAGAPDPVFIDKAVVNAQVKLYELGTYTLRLTADDGYGAKSNDVTILVSASGSFPEVSVTATETAVSETQPDTGSYTITRTGATTGPLDVYFTLGGSATEVDDYTIDAISPVTIPAGEASIDIILTPVDDIIYSEGLEVASLSIAFDTGYTTGTAFGNIAIADNDNHEPVVDAGTNRQIVLGNALWTPSNITTEAWYDAAAADTITESGGSVWQWADKSGNTNHATQVTASLQPTTGTRTIGGVNVLDFDAASPNHLLTPLEQLTTVSMYFVADADVRGTSKYSGVIGANANGYGANSGLFNPLEDYSTTNARNPYFYTNDGGVSDYYVDGVYQAIHNFTPAIFSHQGTGLATANLDYYIGNSRGNLTSTWAFEGGIGEIIICPADHDVPTRQKVEGYLAHKWGLEASLPSNHLYKSAAPTAPSVAVTLVDASVSDEDVGDTVSQYWTVVSHPGTIPTFDNTNMVNATVTFTVLGTNVLRLTADDGYGPIYDEVAIIVKEFGSTTTNHSVPHSWLAGIDPAWTNDYEAAALADPDGDGFSTWQEYWSGTDPVNSNSFLRIDSIAMTGGDLVLQWRHEAMNGAIPPILIQASTDLTSSNWFAAGTNPATNGTNSWLQPAAQQRLYYRLKATQAP